MEEFEKELTHLINRHSIENVADMPDFLLARMLCAMIESIGPTVKATLDWHGCNSVCHPRPNTGLEPRGNRVGSEPLLADSREDKMTTHKLIAWLREHSSGIYRPSAEAADLIERMAEISNEHDARARMANFARCACDHCKALRPANASREVRGGTPRNLDGVVGSLGSET